MIGKLANCSSEEGRSQLVVDKRINGRDQKQLDGATSNFYGKDEKQDYGKK